VRPRLVDVGQTQRGDHVVEHSGAEPAPHGLVVAQQLPNGVNLLGVAPAYGLAPPDCPTATSSSAGGTS